ncbi:Uma2 family endonuclease [Epidermidibacterium keratini]|uniref:Uma2 family endonuclease n=1 Tax=Epidermidibacterium keratini TaxID=1891644 RepID=A0A7L4YLD8_9ACTN|nr:Uma2 family endonuclease [Epidermidibacterium keratini]QHB99877.1 Uma2 family endonuclease [Epidermidibacterium keratini]
MSVMETLQVQGHWTERDLETLPDDGHRYEIIDGVLLVNAAPIPDHQEVALRLWRLLDDAAPDSLRVLVAPVDVVLANDTVVEPDVVVALRADFSGTNLPGVPLLAVEVLSPGTRRIDLAVKLERYRRAGIASYWVIDPATLRLVARELVDGEYVVVADIGDAQTWDAILPFAVSITPSRLLRGR